MASLNTMRVMQIRELEDEILELEQTKKEINVQILKKRSDINEELLDYYSMTEASDRLEVSVNTIIKRVRSNYYSGTNVGGKFYVIKEEIDEEVMTKRRLERGI